MERLWIYEIPGKAVAETVVRQLDTLPHDVLVGLAVFATGTPGAVSWFVLANTKSPTPKDVYFIEKTLAVGRPTTHTLESLLRLRPHLTGSGSGRMILQGLRSVDGEGYHLPAKGTTRQEGSEPGAQSIGEQRYCDFSINQHIVEDDDGATISAQEVARFYKAYAHMVFDQLPKRERRKIRERGEEAAELAKHEAVARGLRLVPIDPSDPPGYQAVGDWLVCRLHRAQWETYKLRYPPDDLA